MLLLAVIATFVVYSRSNSTAIKTSVSAVADANSQSALDPLDQLSSADIAVNVARATNLAEATAVTNQAESVHAQLAITQSSDSLIAKPQVVASAFKSSKDIQLYYVKSGESVQSIAAKFDITSDSVRWSNNLEGDTVSPGQKLYIPPVNGIVYVVKSGDTPASLASTYSANKQLIIAYNDAELTGLHVGARILIPNGQPPSVSNSNASATSSLAGGFAWGSTPVYGYNGYDYGYCTWYVATQVSVPANWGNAATWAYYAAQEGWTVSSRPSVGAIAETPNAAGGEGHVAMVRGVSSDGSKVLIQDMNGIAGWGQVGEAWQATSEYPNYITH